VGKVSEMGLLGVDIGSSRCKAVVFDGSGRALAEAVENYTPYLPALSRVEADPEALWSAVASAIRRAASQSQERVFAMGLSSHGESFLPVDGGGRALAPVIMNTDNRATEEARWWQDLLGREHIFQMTGLIVHPMYPMAKLRWLRLHEPDLFSAAARFVSVSDYALLKLGLEPCIPYSLACRFMAFDVRALRWSEEILEAAALSPDRLPTPVPSGTVVGRLSRSVAAELGLDPGVPVVVGGHDQPCGALGVGAIAPGMVTDSLGTYECLVAVADQPCLDVSAFAASLNSYCHAVPDSYITIAYFPAGLMLKWFCDSFCQAEADAAKAEGIGLFEYIESTVREGPTGLCVTPHLIGSANPHFDPRATGAIVGITQNTKRSDIYKGILEGLACELAIVAELLASAVGPFDTIRCSGGGARSRLGLQLRAAIAGRRMQTLDTPEAVCLGVALLTGVAAGAYGSLDQAVTQAVRVTETVAPDAALAAAYRRQVEQYRRLYPALAPLREA
jgi:xylulokinase